MINVSRFLIMVIKHINLLVILSLQKVIHFTWEEYMGGGEDMWIFSRSSWEFDGSVTRIDVIR